MLLLCTLPTFVHRSFVSRDIITSSDNALIQGLLQGTKGVSHGSKLIRKLPPCSPILNLPSRLLCPSLSTHLFPPFLRFSPFAYTFLTTLQFSPSRFSLYSLILMQFLYRLIWIIKIFFFANRGCSEQTSTLSSLRFPRTTLLLHRFGIK